MDPILAKLQRHFNLQRLILSNCGIGDLFFVKIIDLLDAKRARITDLDMSQNELTSMSMKRLGSYLRDISVSEKL